MLQTVLLMVNRLICKVIFHKGNSQSFNVVKLDKEKTLIFYYEIY